MSAGIHSTEPLRIARDGTSTLRVSGAMTFATAAKALPEGLRQLQGCEGPNLVIDCGGVTAADSAGLAVLVEWLAWARRAERHIELRELPRSLIDIARISELEDLLEPAG